MRPFEVLLLVLALTLRVADADAGPLRAAKARFISKLHGKHHKRGILPGVPTFKLGHDVPVVSHSLVKPLLVTYPPTSHPFAVKIPLSHPSVHHYPASVGHRVPVPHPHYGLKFPHHTKSVINPSHHFHHHHHHVEPKPVPVLPATPVVPVLPAPPLATPVVPLARPTVHALPPPTPPVFLQQTPQLLNLPVPVASPTPVNFLPPHQLHLRSFAPPSIAVPQAPLLQTPVVPIPNPYSYVLRPGNALQTSLFATYPRFPFVNVQHSLVPYPAPAPPSTQVYLDHPAQVPVHVHQEQPSAVFHTNIEQQSHFVEANEHGSDLDHGGWSPIPAHAHISYDINNEHDAGNYKPHEQVPQVYENNSQDDQHIHNLQEEIHQHIQHQIEQQVQFDQQPSAHPNHNYGTSSHFHHLSEEVGQANQEYGAPQQHIDHYYGVPQQVSQEYGSPPQQVSQEYGAPHQGLEGRSAKSEDSDLKYHNHIPLGLQPPLDQPLQQFR